VVDESGDVALLCRVNDLVRAEGHEVVMGRVVSRVLLCTVFELLIVQHFTDVLHYKRTTVTIVFHKQSSYIQSSLKCN